ncbi:MAG TPA: LPS-assembly protein LptD, partial [Methylophilaceae bacterium]|nr:LPS-assembly protein LptD [Methylophilaceae bacterium]
MHIEPNPTADASTANVAPGIVIIEGDRLQVYLNRKYKSIGNAALHRNNQDIYGDSIEYDTQDEELHVVGNTRIETKTISLWGQELHLKLDDGTGEMTDASFRIKGQVTSLPQTSTTKTTSAHDDNLDANAALTETTEPLTSQNIEDGASLAPTLKRQQNASRGDAKTILFEGQDKKRLKDARYTTCAADSDDWYIKAKEIELNDYTKSGTAWNARVEFKGVPLLYTPWISFSLLNQRKSGFLAPTVGTTSRSGFEVLVPYYWNFSPNLDATFAARYLSKRGTQMQGEMRYLGETYSGIDNIEYLPNDDLSGQNRYYANLKHQQSFSNGWSAGYHLEKVSDDQYFSDLSTRITTTSRVNLAQQGTISYSDDVWSFSGLVQRFQTLDDVSFPYERLPQLTLTADKDWGIVNTNLYSQWVNFDRNPDAPITLRTVSGGVLTTSVTGSRLTAYPSVSVPFAKPYGYITPKFGIHYTDYGLNNRAFTNLDKDGVITDTGEYESATRTLPIFSLDSGLYFDRDMRVVKNHYTQTLEPRLYYVYIPNRDQDNLPVFDSADSDLNLGTLFLENQFTGNDRVNNANQLSLAVTTRMIDSKTGEQRLAATLGQRFYFTDQKVSIPGAALRTGNNSDIVAAVTARLTNHWNVDAAWQYDTDSSNTVKSNIGARFNPEPGKVLNLSYRYTEDSLEQINVSGQWPFGRGWYGMGRWNYSIREHNPIEGLAGIEYDAGCWQARTVLQQVSTATANSNYAIFFQLELGG